MPLTSAAEYKAHNPSAASIADATVLVYIAAATDALERATGRWFALDDYVEVVDGEGAQRLEVQAWPIVSVASVEVIDGDGNPLYEVPSESYGIDAEAGIVYRTPFVPYRISILASRLTGRTDWWSDAEAGIWPRGNRNIRITYEGGYDPAPPDLKLAIWTIVDTMISNRGADANLRGETLGSYSYSKGGIEGVPYAGVVQQIAMQYGRARV